MIKTRAKIVCSIALAVVLVFMLAGHAAAEKWPKAIAIAAGHPGGGVHTIATGMGSILSKYLKIKAAGEVGSFGKNIVLLHKGDVDFGMAQVDIAYEAARGLAQYKQFGKMKIRQIFSGSTPPGAFISKAKSGIKKMADLKGKKVMLEMPAAHNFTHTGDLILKAAGMKRSDFIHLKQSNPVTGRNAMMEGRVDAFFCLFPSVGKTAWAEEINRQSPIYLTSAESEKGLDRAIADVPYARKGILYAKYYRDMVGNKDLLTLGFPHVFLGKPDLPDDFVYAVMKVFYDHLDELITFHIEAKAYLANPLDVAVLPYHAGAIKYYKEKGLWTPKLEERQKELLSEIGVSK